MRQIGFKLRQARESAGLTQEVAAGIAKIHTRALQRLEAGQGNPTLNTLLSAANALGTHLIVFLGDGEDEELFDLFGRATARNRALILGYIRGLLEGHQPSGVARSKRTD